MPVIPAVSLREPTRYQIQNVATGASCTSRVITIKPFPRVCAWTGYATVICLLLGIAVRAEKLLLYRVEHGHRRAGIWGLSTRDREGGRDGCPGSRQDTCAPRIPGS